MMAPPVTACVILAIGPAFQPETKVRDVPIKVSEQQLLSDLTGLLETETRHTLSAVGPDAAQWRTTKRGSTAAANWLERRLREAGAETKGPGSVQGSGLGVYQQHFIIPKGSRVPAASPGCNVIAILPRAGSELPTAAGLDAYLSTADAVVVIAHYDTRVADVMDATSAAPGANDNGSGTVAVLEAARAICAAGIGKRALTRDLVFVLSTGEEQGLLGARHLAQVMQTAAVDVLNMDIVGDPTGHQLADGTTPRDDGRVRVFSEALPRELSAEGLAGIRAAGGENDSMSRQLSRYVHETAVMYGTRMRPMLIQRADRFLRGGDHISFNETGKAGVRFTQVFENYDRQHQLVAGGKGDTLEFVDPRYLAGVTELVGVTAVRLAASPRPPTTVELVVADLTHDTVLRWKASPSTSAVSYRVVWRETTSPVWTDSVDAGATLGVTLPMNKDNYFFGVRAVDADGNMGMVRPAAPVRK